MKIYFFNVNYTITNRKLLLSCLIHKALDFNCLIKCNFRKKKLLVWSEKTTDCTETLRTDYCDVT